MQIPFRPEYGVKLHLQSNETVFLDPSELGKKADNWMNLADALLRLAKGDVFLRESDNTHWSHWSNLPLCICSDYNSKHTPITAASVVKYLEPREGQTHLFPLFFAIEKYLELLAFKKWKIKSSTCPCAPGGHGHVAPVSHGN